MDVWRKVEALGEAAQYDICRGCGTHTSRVRDDVGRWIYPAVRPDGKRLSMLKVLQSNYCENDCAYCAHRSGRDCRRTSFSPDELARIFDRLARQGRVEGLFLSSGVWGGSSRATERMLDTVSIVRRRYHFDGYVHLKILPGADDASIEASVRMASRVSVNLEAPNAARLRAITQAKDFDRDLLGPLRTADRVRRQMGRAVSITTQFVVGASDEPDRELLASAAALYQYLRLARVYYSAFQPVQGTPLEDHPPTPTWREHRLYQADFLLRQYGFRFQDLGFEQDGNLSRDRDPKLDWALRHPECFPVEVNSASRAWLLRVPGIGPVSARRIMGRRRQAALRDLDHLGITAAGARRAAPFLLLDGRRPSFQLGLWEMEYRDGGARACPMSAANP